MKFILGLIIWSVISLLFAMAFGQFMAGIKDRERKLIHDKFGPPKNIDDEL